MSTLGKGRIETALKEKEASDRLFITPLLDPTQIAGASIDMRLGFDFVTVRRGNVGAFDPAASTIAPGRFRAPHLLNIQDCFYLHPNEMVLASTLEYIKLPKSISAYVTSRSKWGRLGLVIATATAIHPGFVGTITLELVNHGNVPLVLYPGLAIAQLILSEALEAETYVGTLARQTGPRAVELHENKPADLAFWVNTKK